MEELFSLKQAVHAACLEMIQQRIQASEGGMQEARESSMADTKSSAGDKHETARAMAQLELEKQDSALQHLRDMEFALARIDPSQRNERISPGALVHTNKGLYYVSAAMGKLDMDGAEVLAISMQAPILVALKAIAVGGTCKFNGQAHTLLGIA